MTATSDITTTDGTTAADERSDRSSGWFTARRSGDRPWEVLAPSAATAGRLIVGDAVLEPRTAGPNLHLHDAHDECGYVVAGTATFRIGDEVFEAGPGTLVWMPRGVPHTFANRTDEPVRLLGIALPGSLEEMFLEQDAYFATLDGPPDEEVVRQIGLRHGCHRVGPPLAVDG